MYVLHTVGYLITTSFWLLLLLSIIFYLARLRQFSMSQSCRHGVTNE